MCCLQKINYKYKVIARLPVKVNKMKYIWHAKTNKKKAKETIFISGKIDLRMRNITGDKVGQ